MRTFKVPTSRKFVKKGVFGEKGKIAVSGSDHGAAYIFSLNNLQPIQQLAHGCKKEMIQAVEVLWSSLCFGWIVQANKDI